MPKTATPRPEVSEQEHVDRWREEMLIEAGYPKDAALIIAADNDINLHAACDLIANGCDPTLAARILL